MTFGQLNNNPLKQTQDEFYMRRCIHLALNGKLTTAPNPMVGAVVVYNGKIIGEGYHAQHGGPHAEVNAINSVKEEDRHLLTQSTIYASLEPCSHFGKTPPCADLIIRTGIPRVVIGCRDTNVKVNGGGIKKLLDAGIDVECGVLEKECRELNKHFFVQHELLRPFITLKWAQSSNGIIGCNTSDSRLMISDSFTQMLCHKLRAEHQAIIVGRKTWQHDKPQLNVRNWIGRNPKIIIFSHDTDLEEELNGLQSVLVEGGRETLQYFIDNDLWDEAYVEVSSLCINKKTGAEYVSAPILKNSTLVETTNLCSYQNNLAQERQVFLYHRNHL